MTPREFLCYRLINQLIVGDPRRTPSEVVGWLGAMQAQDYAGGLWAIGLRSHEAMEADVERALSERTILRTWPMRGTLHFVAAADARWMLELLTPRMVARSALRVRQLELDEATFSRSRKLFIRALRGGKTLTRDAMGGLLERAGISTAGQRGYHILWRHAQDGVICFGAREGKQHTFALLDEWAPSAKSKDREEALAELARRYFTSHGPATIADFAWWSGLKTSDAKAGLEMAKGKLFKETMSGVDYWMPGSMGSARDRAPVVHLLPGFDEYMLGYTDRSAALDPMHSEKIVPGNNGVFMPTIVVRGQVEGTWKRVLKRGTVNVEARPFAELNKTETRAFAVAAERYGRFLGLPVCGR